MNRLGRILSVVAAAALLMAGCGSDGSEQPSAAEWADSVCSSINTWKSSVVAAAESAVSGGLDKEALQSAADKAKSATDSLESDLGNLEQPDTASGDQAQSTVDQLSSQLKAGTDSIKSSIDGITGVSDVVSAADAVRSALATMQGQVATAATSLRQIDPSDELVTAFRESPSCQQLATSTPSAT